MLRAIYLLLLRLHPRRFREQFADEMLWIFDQAPDRQSVVAWLGDALGSLAVQWMFRSEFEEAQPLTLAPIDRVPVFYTSESDLPPPGALLQGLIGSVAVFAFASFLLAHSGGQGRVFTYYGSEFHAGPQDDGGGRGPVAQAPGSPGVWEKVVSLFHRPSGGGANGTISVATNERGAVESRGRQNLLPAPPETPAARKEREARMYFRSVKLLAALDSNGDGEISALEIANAPQALLTLDIDGDGKLDAEESGLRKMPPRTIEESVRSLMWFDKNGDGKLQRSEIPPPLLNLFRQADGDQDGVLSGREVRVMGTFMTTRYSQMARRERLTFIRLEPVFVALDTDHNGEISGAEMLKAPTALKTLDRNHDGALTLEEVRRDPVASEVAALFRLDTNFDGKISLEERLDPFARQARLLLDAADLHGNRDGYVSWEELAREIRRRADLNRDGVVTVEEMMAARKSGVLYGAGK